MNHLKMASNDDGDLIDLGNDACVPRVTVDDPIPEEQEHLLDVCLPKLEQKLSLSKRQEQVLDSVDKGDILVTLGHDQVVPIRKRIDVVSSDTIKRVRDITRNLEPVIRRTRSCINEETQQDTVDHVTTAGESLQRLTAKHEDETYETQEINNAFNFLAEHDDHAEDQEAETSFDHVRNENNRSISSMRPLIEEEDVVDCSLDVPSSSKETIDRSNEDDRRDMITRNDNQYDVQLDNPAFESSSNSAQFSMDAPTQYGSISVDTESHTTVFKKRHREDVAFKRESKRRSLQESHRKSWTEGASLNSAGGLPGIDRSTSLEEHHCTPSTSNVGRGISSFLTRRSPEVESVATTSVEDGCSDGSEVDWSWLKEVEYLRTSESSGECAVEPEGRSGSISPTNGSTGRRRARERHETAANHSVAMSVGATAKSLAIGGSRWPPSSGALLLDRRNSNVRRSGGQRCWQRNADNNGNNDDNNDDDEIAHCNITNEVADRENRDGTTSAIGSVTATANSWMRASMRRLRHLRLPDGTQRNNSSSAGINEPVTNRFAQLSTPNSLPDIALIAPEILAAQTNSSTSSTLRPSSAPARSAATSTAVGAGAATPRRAGRQFAAGGRLRTARSWDVSSRQDNLGSTASDVTASDSPATCSSSFGGASSNSPSSTATSPQRAVPRRVCERQRDVDRRNDRSEDDDEDENSQGKWPHALSSALACLSCTLGLFNISRFAILSIQFGANFIIQFLFLSFILGIPLLTLQVCFGQRLAAGSVDMWRISPLFQGVGIALLTAQALIGIYSIVGISWMFVYFRDSFITKQDKYRWAEPFLLYRDDSRPTHNITTSYKLYETVPDYFNGAVLQRHHLTETDIGSITLKFQVAFNLAVVWLIVFVSLSKGLRSYGKVVYVFTLVPIFGTFVLCTKLLGLTPPGSIHQLFPATVWSEFFINGKSWVAASSEVFLTWGLFGAAAMQIAAHNKHKHLLQRDMSLVVILTFIVLILAAFLANTCVQILKHHGYIYITSSFERMSMYTFMRLANQPAPPGYSSTPERFMSHASFILGQRAIRPGADTSIESGYQVLRLSTELVPATLALLGAEQVSPFWAVLFYFILILFGIAQQLAIWHCVITGIMAINTKMMKLWETSITFFSCTCGYMLGLPMATELGIGVVYYLDYTIGGAWWIIILYLVQIGAVFIVRGRPHTGDAVVTELFPPTGRYLKLWAGPLLAFIWNVILPVTLMVLSITIFKNSGFRELYSYRLTNRDYWLIWARQLGAAIQLIPILMIPAVAIIQTCRYLNSGPPDIFDNQQVEITVNHCEQCNGRIQLLYRPPLESEDPRDTQIQIGNDTDASLHGNGILPAATTDIPFEDPPPKYTPPPSYTTATGARIAKMLRQSFRRSMRRITNALGESSAPRQRPALQPPPPDYATVLVEMNQTNIMPALHDHIAIHVSELQPDVTNTGTNRRAVSADHRHRPNTIDRTSRIGVVDRSCTIERTHSTLEPGHRLYQNIQTNLTAADVANLLRSSIRRGTARTQQSLRRSFCHETAPTTAASIENLVEAAAPIGEDSLILSKDASLVPDEQIDEHCCHGDDDDNNDRNDEKKTVDAIESSVPVI